MKRYSTSLAIRGIQIKTMMTYHYTPIIYVRWTEIKNSDNTKCWQGYGETGSHTLLVGMKNGTAFLENSLAVFLKN